MTARGDLPIHVVAFLNRETAGWPAYAVGAHIRLIGHAWLNSADGSLPDDPAELSAIAGVDPRFWGRWIAPIVLKLWPLHLDNRRRTQLIENVFASRREFSELQRVRAKKGWATKKSTRLVDKPVETCGSDDLSSDSHTLFFGGKFNGINGATHAIGMPNLKIRESESYYESESSLRTHEQADTPPNNKSKNSKNGLEKGEAAPHRPASNVAAKRDVSPPSHTGNPRQAWERKLAQHLGAELYAKVIPILERDPALCQRATTAERRQPGSGAVIIAVELRKPRRLP